MQTHAAKRVEITIEKVMESRLTAALRDAGVTGGAERAKPPEVRAWCKWCVSYDRIE